jgi:hypothetical protein
MMIRRHRPQEEGQAGGTDHRSYLGDAPTWTYPLTWTFGGMESDPTGKKVVLNSRNTVEAVKWMVSFWKDACDEGAPAGDDTAVQGTSQADRVKWADGELKKIYET